jgi:phage/plasmid-like protein (TIGR03299 family)
MAHEVETMAYAGQVPWHGLGTKVSNDLSVEQMLVAAGIDWEVEKTPLFYESADYEHEIEDKFALIRKTDGKLMDIVGPNWKPLQNREAFNLFDNFVKQGDMEMHTAGSLKGGQIVWGLAKIHDTFEIVKDDVIEPYLLFVNPHQRGKAIEVRSTAIRVVCQNTCDFALRSESKKRITVNHNQQWDEAYVLEMLGLAHRSFETYKDTGIFLASKLYKEAQVQNYFNAVFPNTGTTDEDSKNSKFAMEVLLEQPGNAFAEGSWWQAFNAVTHMTDHTLGRSADTRLASAWFGQNRARKHKALELAVKFASAS